MSGQSWWGCRPCRHLPWVVGSRAAVVSGIARYSNSCLYLLACVATQYGRTDGTGVGHGRVGIDSESAHFSMHHVHVDLRRRGCVCIGAAMGVVFHHHSNVTFTPGRRGRFFSNMKTLCFAREGGAGGTRGRGRAAAERATTAKSLRAGRERTRQHVTA